MQIYIVFKQLMKTLTTQITSFGKLIVGLIR